MSERENLRDWAARLEASISGAGNGDVTGPEESLADRVVLWGDVIGEQVKSSEVSISEAGSISIPIGQTVDGVDLSIYGASLSGHIARTDDPHEETSSSVVLSSVSNNAQLKRANGDFPTFSSKVIDGADYLLIEDSEAGFAKKRVLASAVGALITPPTGTLVNVVSVVANANSNPPDISFVDSGLSLTFTTEEDDTAVARFSALCLHNNNGMYCRMVLDGTPYSSSRPGTLNFSSEQGTMRLVRVFTGLSAGSHTLKIQIRHTGGGTAQWGSGQATIRIKIVRPSLADPEEPEPEPSLRESLGIVANLTPEHIDAAVSLGVGWIRATDAPEWGFHASEASYNSAVSTAGSSGIWPQLVSFSDGVALAHASGIKVLAHAMAAPTWARGSAAGGGVNQWHQALLPTYRTHFAEYCRQLCLCGIDAIEITNEPNLSSQYAFSPDHPRASFPAERNDDYVLLLRAVYSHLKADSNPVVSGVPVGTGGTASVGHEQLTPTAGIQPTNWYRRMFNATADDRTTPVSASGAFDFISHHPYAWHDGGPNDWDVRWVDQADDAAYWQGIACTWRIRQELVAAGEGDKKIWATELGAPTNGVPPDDFVTEAEQAQRLTDYILAWTSTGSTGFSGLLASSFYGSFTGPLFVYQLRDRSDGSAPPLDQEGYFGLQHLDGSEKPAAEVLRSA